MRLGDLQDKKYVVTVDKEVTPEFLKKMSEGIYLEELDMKTRPCLAEKAGSNSFRIILTQGLNRQIRRMSEALGYKVTELVRVRIMNIELGNLKRGEYRSLTDEELNELYEELKGSENAPGGRGR